MLTRATYAHAWSTPQFLVPILILILLRKFCERLERVDPVRRRNTPVAEQGAALVGVKVLIAIRGSLPGGVTKPVAPAKLGESTNTSEAGILRMIHDSEKYQG
jgi:hypothetical protein